MIKRSRAMNPIKHVLKLYNIEKPIANEILDALESAGVEFAPEPSAVEKFNGMLLRYNNGTGSEEWPEWLNACLAMRDELQAWISNLESRLSENKNVTKQDRHIIFELQNDYENWDMETKRLKARIADLESQVDIIADENQALEKRIEEKDAEIERLTGLPTPECKEVCYLLAQKDAEIKFLGDDIERLKQTPRCEPMDEECPRKERFDPSGITHAPESSELVKFKAVWESYFMTGCSRSVIEGASKQYIRALESENARLRGGR